MSIKCESHRQTKAKVSVLNKLSAETKESVKINQGHLLSLKLLLGAHLLKKIEMNCHCLYVLGGGGGLS